MASAEALLLEVLQLSPTERADVAVQLLASLEEEPVAPEEEVARAWGAEIDRRARRVLAGQSAGIPWETVERDLRKRLTER